MSLMFGINLVRNEPMLVMLLLAFVLLACLMIPLYFYVRKPKLGTIEWIGRLDPVHFGALKCYALRGADVIWSLLTAGKCPAGDEKGFSVFPACVRSGCRFCNRRISAASDDVRPDVFRNEHCRSRRNDAP